MESFPNLYTHRRVAPTASKACDICYKPSTSVLVAPENRDFFYVCPGHLKDRSFCQPIIDHEAIAAREKNLINCEIGKLKLEYQEKLLTKKAEAKKDEQKRQEKEKEKEDKEGDKDVDPRSEDKNREKNETEKKTTVGPKETKPERVVDTLRSASLSHCPAEEEVKTFALINVFYQSRLAKKKRTEQAKRNIERLKDLNLFPSVPKHLP